jgi:hypothetical protein
MMRCLSGSLLTVLVCCAGAISTADENNSWTNLAGHALRAVPQAIQGQTVTFMKNGRTVSYPLSVFLPTEQERLRCALTDTAVPEGLQSAYAFAARAMKRSRLMYEKGDLAEADYQQILDETLAAFRKQVAPFVVQKKISPERLELIVRKLISPKA